MLRKVLSDTFRSTHSLRNNPYFSKFSLIHPSHEAIITKNYSLLSKCKYNKVKCVWNAVSVRNNTNRSRKDMLMQYFYKNIYQSVAIISASTLFLFKLIGLKLFLLQLAPILFLIRHQLPIIKHTFSRDIKLWYKYLKTLGVYNTYENKNMTLYNSFKEVAKKYPDDVMFLFGDNKWTYKEMIILTDKLALYFHKKEFDKGDVIGIFMSNRPDYVGIILALSKLGSIACLLNKKLKRKMLLARIEGIKCKALVVSSDLMPTIEEIKDVLVTQKIKLYLYDGPTQNEAFINLKDELSKLKTEPLNLQYQVTFHDKILYTFTGNTFGYPSHTAISNAKFIFTALAATEFLEAKKSKDVIYSVLPFDKAENIATSLGPTILMGVKAVIRNEFSVEDYFKDCKINNCTLAQYGGEMGKHLSARQSTKFDKIHKIKYMFGRGMHHNIWEYVQDRFNVRIIEYYGTTASNIHLVNINFHRGAVGYVSKLCPPIFHPYQIIRVLWHNVEPIRTQGGVCDRVENYETGVLVGLITHRPDSQFQKCKVFDKDGKERNIIHNVVRKGDKGYFSGDLFLRDKFGYLYYHGLAGDNFRWQSENISVQEVEDIIRETIRIKSFMYYGVRVPNSVDRAGMIVIKDDGGKLDLVNFMKIAKENMANYAVPIFVRVTNNIVSAHASRADRIKYEDEGFDPRKLSQDKLFYWNKKTDKYEILTEDIYADIAVDKILL